MRCLIALIYLANLKDSLNSHPLGRDSKGDTLEITTYSTQGKAVGTKHRYDRSRPGQRCITYHDKEVTNIKQTNKTKGDK